MKPEPPDFQVGDKFVADYTFDSTVPATAITGSNSLDVLYLNVVSSQFRFDRGYTFDSPAHKSSPFTGEIFLADNKISVEPTGRDIYAATLDAFVSIGLPLPSGRGLSFIGIDLEDATPTGNPDLLSSLSLSSVPPNVSLADLAAGGRIVYEGLGTPDQPFFAIDSMAAVPEPSSIVLSLLASGLILAGRFWRGPILDSPMRLMEHYLF